VRIRGVGKRHLARRKKRGFNEVFKEVTRKKSREESILIRKNHLYSTIGRGGEKGRSREWRVGAGDSEASS